MKKNVAIVEGDDWSGIYIDGKLVSEGHSIHWRYLAEAIGLEVTRVTPDQEWMEFQGRLPDRLSDVKAALRMSAEQERGK